MMTDSIFESAARAYGELADFRRRRRRYINYTFGRQWSDTVTGLDGRPVSEEEFTIQMGKKPLTNNLIRQLIKTVTGHFRRRLEEEEDPGGLRKSAAGEMNMIDELDCRMLEEFLISGCALQRIVAERRPSGSGIWIDNIDPDRLIVNRFSDPRGTDIELIGMIHDMSFGELAGRLAPRGGERLTRLRQIYDRRGESFLSVGEPFGRAPEGRVRAIEVWTLESIGKHRRGGPSRIETRWTGRWYAPDGSLLDSRPSGWAHGSHPFALKLYPLTAGEIHPLVADVIDQQRSVNRLLTLIDHVIGTTAKGALLFPVDQLPQGVDWEYIADQWSRPDGLVIYQPTGMGKPEQLVTSKEPTSAYHLLELELKLMDRASGMSDALRGQATTSNSRSAAIYESQIENGGLALRDTFAAFEAWRRERDRKTRGMEAPELH